jgi:hypothetical protein
VAPLRQPAQLAVVLAAELQVVAVEQLEQRVPAEQLEQLAPQVVEPRRLRRAADAVVPRQRPVRSTRWS